MPRLNEDQRVAVTAVLNAVRDDAGGVFFIDGPGGSGKTFVYRVILASVRASGNVALTVASSCIAALLLEGGRTSHSALKIPVEINRDSVYNITQTSDTAAVLRAAMVIVWDEAPAQHRHCAEAVYRTLRDILGRPDVPFKRKVVVFGGDFRQCPPVVARGSRPAIVAASLRRSVLWRTVRTLRLTENMRIRHDDDARPFAEYILRVGNGEDPPVRGNDAVVYFGDSSPSAGDEIALYTGITRCETLEALINKVYPSLRFRFADQGYVDGRAILTTENAAVNQLNDTIATLIPGEEHFYLSADSVAADDDQAVVYGAEFLNKITVAGMPPHRLVLKIGLPLMLLSNIDAGTCLCNGTRLIVRRLGRRVILAEIAGGSHNGQWIHIPRITKSSTGQRWPFTLRRRQFPLQFAFAMTINKDQGQTMEIDGIHPPEPVFTHGQLYVALSRASRVSGVALHCPNGESTTNVVYREMLQ